MEAELDEPRRRKAGPGGPSVPSRVWRATTLLFLARQWGALCTAATLALLARHLAVSDFGVFTFYLAAFALLDVLVDFGTGTVTLQASASPRYAGVLGAARRLRLAASVLAALLFGAAVVAFESGPARWVALAGLYPLTRALEASGLELQRRIAWGPLVGVRATSATLRLATVVTLVALDVHAVAAFLLAHAAWVAAGNVAVHVVARPSLPAPATAPVGAVLRAALPLALAALAQVGYVHVDNLFVRGLLGEEALGRYNAAARLFSWLALVAALATGAALPWLVERHRAGALRAATTRLALRLLGGGLLAVLLLWPWAGELLSLVFGAGFAEAAPSLRWLLLAAVTVYAGAAYLTALLAAGRSWTAAGLTLVALSANVAGNLAWIPRLGIEGAAIATLASELVVLTGAFLAVRRVG